MKILYHKPSDIVEFDIDRYWTSLNKYGKVDKEVIVKALEEMHYDPMHYSVLVELGVALLPDDKSAKAYYKDHKLGQQTFERLRRITGYLVGSLERWNDGKKAEEHDRVKHGLAGQYGPETKDELEVRRSIDVEVRQGLVELLDPLSGHRAMIVGNKM